MNARKEFFTLTGGKDFSWLQNVPVAELKVFYDLAFIEGLEYAAISCDVGVEQLTTLQKRQGAAACAKVIRKKIALMKQTTGDNNE